MRTSIWTLLSLLWLAISADAAAVGDAPAANGQTQERVSLLTPEQLIQMLDETVDWYRTLGTQRQSATQPSDMLLLYANQQIADQVIALTFQIARANAELLSSEAGAAAASENAQTSPTPRRQEEGPQKLHALEDEMQSARRQLTGASGRAKTNLQAKLDELQGELAMLKAQQNMLSATAQFVRDNERKQASITALKARIDAIAATIPAANAAESGSTGAQPGGVRPGYNTVPTNTSVTALRELGIWDLGGEGLKFLQKLRSIDAIDQGTRALQETFQKIRDPADQQLRALSERADELATAADTANGPQLKDLRDRFDRLTWFFGQTSAMAVPLSKVSVLLAQYRENLVSWRALVKKQNRELFGILQVRIAVLFTALGAVLAVSELWRRAVLRYANDMRHRNQLLLIRRIITWMLIILILALTLVTHISSFATFAGLLTAGLAVAMQSVLVSVVGYFMLIGRYGVRVGDRVQIGDVNGEIINLGLIRMQLLELTTQGTLTATGRVVAFANSIVFQSSGGLFRQIPGVNFSWHVLTLPLPTGIDYSELKDRLLAKLSAIVNEHRGDIVQQVETIKQTAFAAETVDVTPQVRLQYSTSGVEVKVRYPVQLNRAAQVDERVSLALHEVINELHAEVKK